MKYTVLEESITPKVKLIKDRYYRVYYPPMPNHESTTTTFGFLPDDRDSQEYAELRAFKHRDDHFLISKSSLTGYTNISIHGTVDKKGVDTICIKVRVEDNKNHKPLDEVFYLKDYPRFRDAMDTAIKVLADRKNVGVPLVVIYDFALSLAIDAGYKLRTGDPVKVSPKPTVGSIIVDNKTGEEGTILSIISGTTVTAVFPTGKPTRIIENDILYGNMQTTRLENLKKVNAKLESKELSSREQRSLLIDKEKLELHMEYQFRMNNGNRSLPKSEKAIVKNIESKVKKFTGLKIHSRRMLNTKAITK